MPFGSNKNKGNSKKAYAFKIRQKDAPSPYFEVKERSEDGKWSLVQSSEPVNNLLGDLVAIETKENEYNGEMIKSVNMTFETPDEVYFLTVNSSFLGRNLLNSVLNLSDYSNVNISLYMSKPKEEGGRSYPSVAVRQNDELVIGKYKYTDLPKPDETTFKGKLLKDYSKQEDLLRSEVDKIEEKVKNFGKSRREQEPVTQSSGPNDSGVPDQYDTEDVPF